MITIAEKSRSMQPFAFLTEQGRARRLRPLAFAALAQYDVKVARLRLVSNETNCTFRVDAADGKSYALRISLPDVHTKKEIEAEVAWQLAIARETSTQVATPIPTRDGSYVATAGAPGVPEERHCVLFSWLTGRLLEEVVSPAAFETFGALIARLHVYGAEHVPEQAKHLRSMDRLYPFGDTEHIIDESTAKLFPTEDYERLLEMRAASQRELDWLYGSGREPQLIHGDLHWWNVLSYRGQLRLIDFEDVCWGFPVQDIAITFYYTAGREVYPELRAAFQRGYESVRPWPEIYPGQIELLMVHRAIDLFNFVLGSTLREDRDLLDRFVKSIQTHHRTIFERWQSQFNEANYA